jgi:predicted MFS family arabinose efflux permease
MRSVLTILAIWCAGLGAAAQFGKMSVAFPALEGIYQDYGSVGAGLMVSIVGIVGLIFGTTAGLLVARVGARRAILSALVLGAAVSLVESVFPPWPVMMLARVLEGASHLAIVVVGPVAIAAAAPPARQAAAMTLWSSFFGLTYAVLFWIGPRILLDHGPAPLFWGHAIWLLACAAMLAGLMPRDPRHEVGAVGNLLHQHVAIYASPFVAAPATGFVCYTITYVAVLTLLPGLASPDWGGFIGVAMPLVSIGVSLTAGVWLLGRIPAWRLVQAGFAAAVLAALGLWLTWGSGLAEAGFALAMGAALGIVQGASFATIPQLNPDPKDRARAAGAIAQLGNLGTTTGTPLLAFLTERAGASGLALFVLVFSGLGIAVHAVQARRRANA